MLSTRRGASRLAPAVMCMALAVLPAAASGVGANDPRARGSALERVERDALGREHAAAHLAERRALRRFKRLPAARRRAVARHARRASAGVARISADAPASEVGRWSPELFPMPGYALNLVLLPTGKVLFWDRGPRRVGGDPNDRDNVTHAYLWDPTDPQQPARDVSPQVDMDDDGDIDAADNVPLWCSGMSLLPSGEVFAAGGTLSYPNATQPDFSGASFAFTFDPWTEEWTRQPDMRRGRWYPGQVELADGRIAVLAGLDETGDATMNTELEVFTPPAQRGGQGTWAQYPAGELASGWYPHMFTMPNGEVLLGGPYAEDSAALDVGALGGGVAGSAWSDLPNLTRYHNAASAVLLPGGPDGSMRVSVIGGYTGGSPAPSIADVETLDLGAPGAGWSTGASSSSTVTPSLNVPRSNANVVVLPDGSLVTIGGATGKNVADGQNWTDGDQRLKQVELYRPETDTSWRLGPPQQKWRAYHSTAALLPDGRVLSAGDDYWTVGGTPDPYSTDDVDEIYSPPYLFDAAGGLRTRPSITSAPAAIRWADDVGIRVTGVADRAVLVAPSAVTHGANNSQRHVELELLGRVPGEGVNVAAPPSATVAPPGWYMLFVLDAAGTPSTARWVQLSGAAPDAPVLGTGPVVEPTPTPVPTSAPTPIPQPTANEDTEPPKLRLRARAPRRGDRLVRVTLWLDEAGRVTVATRVAGRTVRRAVRFRPGVVRRTLTLRLGSRGAAALRRGIWLRARATDVAGNSTRGTLKVRARR